MCLCRENEPFQSQAFQALRKCAREGHTSPETQKTHTHLQMHHGPCVHYLACMQIVEIQ